MFVGEYSNEGDQDDGAVAVFRPAAGRPGSIMLMAQVCLFAALLLFAGMRWDALAGPGRLLGLGALIGTCTALVGLFFRKTRLFATQDHFGVTNLFGEMTLVPRRQLACIEAWKGYNFRALDGSSLMFVKPAVWRIAQVRELSAFLQVPFEVAVNGRLEGRATEGSATSI